MADHARPADSLVDRLGSWKEIAAHFGRDVRTVQRWEEREGMPVHRHHHARRGSVYAFRSELQGWGESRRTTLAIEAPATATPPQSPPAKEAAVPAPRRTWLAAVLTLVLAGAAVGTWALMRGDRTRPIRSVAVLPLTDLSGDDEKAYFADGLTEAVLTDLAQIRSLRVISRTSVLPYQGKRPPLREIARALNVEALVEGSVSWSSDRVRVTAQLVDVESDGHLWARSYERAIGDAVELQGELARDIANGLRLVLEPGETALLAEKPRPQPEAYQLYLKGRFQAERGGREPLLHASRLFEAGIALDPDWAPLHAALAEASSRLASSGYDLLDPQEAVARAKRAAGRALELDPDLASARAVLGVTRLNFDWDWRGAEEDLRSALALNPSHATAHRWLSRCLLAQGRDAEALEAAQRSLELDPLSPFAHHSVALVHAYGRRYDVAIAQTQETLRMNPDLEAARLLLGVAYLARGDHALAIAAHEAAVEPRDERPWALALLGHAYGRAGRRAEAQEVLQRLTAEARKRPLPSCQLAVVYAGLGQKDEAFRLLEKARVERNDVLLWLKVHPVFDPVRDDPRFERLLRDVGLPPS
jgi:TolB-like protein/lipoprotein NlpI